MRPQKINKFSPHFSLTELIASSTAQRLDIRNIPGKKEQQNLKALCETCLEPIRIAYGRPIKINSGYRCYELNKRIGGSPNSQHTKGEAADLDIFAGEREDLRRGVARLCILAIELKLPFDQLILEDLNSPGCGWVHISHKREGKNRGEVRRKFYKGHQPKEFEGRYPLISPIMLIDMLQEYL